MALVTLTKEQLRRRASRCITEARESEEGHKRKPLQNGGRIPDTWRQQLGSFAFIGALRKRRGWRLII